MCRIDDGELVTVNKTEYRVAAKDHKCTECNRTITKGEKYKHDSALYDGSWSTYKTCQHCQTGMKWLEKECGGYIWTEVIEEIHEHADEYPKMAFPLLKFVVGARRKWKGFGDNSMMPIPNLPEGKYT